VYLKSILEIVYFGTGIYFIRKIFVIYLFFLCWNLDKAENNFAVFICSCPLRLSIVDWPAILSSPTDRQHVIALFPCAWGVELESSSINEDGTSSRGNPFTPV